MVVQLLLDVPGVLIPDKLEHFGAPAIRDLSYVSSADSAGESSTAHGIELAPFTPQPSVCNASLATGSVMSTVLMAVIMIAPHVEQQVYEPAAASEAAVIMAVETRFSINKWCNKLLERTSGHTTAVVSTAQRQGHMVHNSMAAGDMVGEVAAADSASMTSLQAEVRGDDSCAVHVPCCCGCRWLRRSQ